MSREINVIGHDSITSIDSSKIAMIGQALPTGRLLDGSSDHGAYAEYTQPCTLLDGTDATAVYILQDEHVQGSDGEIMEDESQYDWDGALSRIVIE